MTTRKFSLKDRTDGKTLVIFAHVENSSERDTCALEISSLGGIAGAVVSRRPYRNDQELIEGIPNDPMLLRPVPGIFGNGDAQEAVPHTKKVQIWRSLTRDTASIRGEKTLLTREDVGRAQTRLSVQGRYCGNQCFIFLVHTTERILKKFALKCNFMHHQKGGSNGSSPIRGASFDLAVHNIYGGTHISVAFVSVLNLKGGAASLTHRCAAANIVYESLLYGLDVFVRRFLDESCINDDNLIWLHGVVLKFCTELPACFVPLRRNSALATIALSDPKLFHYPVMSYGGIGQIVQMLPQGDTEGLPLHEAVGLPGVLMSYFNVCHKDRITFKQDKATDVNRFAHFEVIRNTRAALAFLLAEEFSSAGVQGNAEDDRHARNYLVPAFSFAGLLSLVHHAIPNQDKEKLFQKSLGMGTLSTYAPSYRGDDKSEGWYQGITKDFQVAVDALQRREFDVALKSVAALQSKGKDLDAITSKLSETERARIVWNVTSSAIARHRSYDETLFEVQMLVMKQLASVSGGEVVDIGDVVRRNITASVAMEFDEAWATLRLAQRCTTASASHSTASATAGSQSQPHDASQQMVVANDLLAMASSQLAKMQPALEHAHQRKDALAEAMQHYRNASQAFKKSNEERTTKSRGQSWNDALHFIYHPVDFRHVESCTRTNESSQSVSSSGESVACPDALIRLSRPAAYDLVPARASAPVRKPFVYSSVTTVRDAQGSVVDIYAADATRNAILSIAKDGQPSTVVAGALDGIAGYSAGRRTACKFRGPQSVCVLTLNSKAQKTTNTSQQLQQLLVIADTGNHCIRFISVAHTQQTEHLGPEIHILAGRSAAPGNADGAAAVSSFRGPTGMVVCTFAPQNDKDTRAFATGQSESIVVCDTDNHVLRVIYHVPGAAEEGRGNGVMANNVFMVHTLVGEAGRPGTEDGTALEGVRLTLPSHITHDEDSGCLFFVEKGKVPAIRMYRDSDSQVTTLIRGGGMLKNPSSLCVRTGSGTPASSSSSSSSSSTAVVPEVLLLVCDPEAKCIWSLNIAQKCLMRKVTLADLMPAVLTAPRASDVVGGSADGEGDFIPIAIHRAAPSTYIISDERRPGELLRFFDGSAMRTAVDASRATFDELEANCAVFSEKFSEYTSTLNDAARSVMLARIVTGEIMLLQPYSPL